MPQNRLRPQAFGLGEARYLEGEGVSRVSARCGPRIDYPRRTTTPARRYGSAVTAGAIATTGLLRATLPVEPWKGASNEKMPPSEATSQ